MLVRRCEASLRELPKLNDAGCLRFADPKANAIPHVNAIKKGQICHGERHFHAGHEESWSLNRFVIEEDRPLLGSNGHDGTPLSKGPHACSPAVRVIVATGPSRRLTAIPRILGRESWAVIICL